MNFKKEKEYHIPGLEDVGTPGNRKPANIRGMTEVIDAYKNGEGSYINTTGTLLTPQEVGRSEIANLSRLENITTTMATDDVNPYLEPNARRDTLIPNLSEAHVTIVGLGGGAPIPVELAKCGIKSFALFDSDTLDAGNLIRHPCGVDGVGLKKVDAVAEYLMRQTGGNLSIRAYAEDVFTSENVRAEIAKSDLLIVATDTESSRFFLNEISVEHSVPTVFVGMFEGGSGGEIFASEPGQGCYCCLAEHSGRKKFIESYVKATRKGDCSSVRDVSAMPGLGMDQGMLCHIAARKSLDILLKNKKHQLKPIGKSWIAFSICGIKNILAESLASLQVDIPKHPSCTVCYGYPQ
jgi:molybdopterin/thiamine biosynthesis adenylyltransferase